MTFNESDHPRKVDGKFTKKNISAPIPLSSLPFSLSDSDADTYTEKFTVARPQVERDFVISRLLLALEKDRDLFTFYGGTALSRTFLPDLRLSEDIDLLSRGESRKDVAQRLHDTIVHGLAADFGVISADIPLHEAKKDTDASIYTIAGSFIKIQLINGTYYTKWPTQLTTIQTRYTGIPEPTLRTLTQPGFVGAKTEAWSERKTARDLYDLWALAQKGAINKEASDVYRRFGSTNHPPTRAQMPPAPPTEDEWTAALGNQCDPQVTAGEAYKAVIEAWGDAAGWSRESEDGYTLDD